MTSIVHIAADDIDVKFRKLAHLIADLNSDRDEYHLLKRQQELVRENEGRTDDRFDEVEVKLFLEDLGSNEDSIEDEGIDGLVDIIEDYYRADNESWESKKLGTIMRLFSELYVGADVYESETTLH